MITTLNSAHPGLFDPAELMAGLAENRVWRWFVQGTERDDQSQEFRNKLRWSHRGGSGREFMIMKSNFLQR